MKRGRSSRRTALTGHSRARVLDGHSAAAHALDGPSADAWRAVLDGPWSAEPGAAMTEAAHALLQRGLLVESDPADGVSRRGLIAAGAATGIAVAGPGFACPPVAGRRRQFVCIGAAELDGPGAL